jgi:hypothetical protein
MRFYHFLALGAGLLLTPAASWGVDDPPKQEKAAASATDLKQAIQEEISAYTKKQTEFRRAQMEASRKDPSKPLDFASQPKADETAKKIMELVKKQPEDPATITGLSWVINNSNPRSEQTQQAAELLLKHHINQNAVAETVQRLAQRADMMYPSGNAEKLPEDSPIRKLVNAGLESKSDKVRGLAHYGLGLGIAQAANNIKTSAHTNLDDLKARLEKSIENLNKQIENATSDERKETLERQKKTLTSNMDRTLEFSKQRKAEAQKHLASLPAMQKEAQGYFEKALPLLKEADPKLATRCQGALNDMHGKLDPGAVAMEIAAGDVEGKDFRLSDYRGKVVMLDFWGHW